MIIEELRIMRGPNMWSTDHHQLIVLKLDLRPFTKNELQKFIRLAENLQLACTEDVPVEQAYCLAAIVSKLATQLQPGEDNLYSGVHRCGRNCYYAVFGYNEEEVGKAAAKEAADLAERAISAGNFSTLNAAKERVHSISEKLRLGPSTGSIVNAARERNIPYRRISGGMIRFGQGRYQKKIAASISENTGNISVDIAGDKDITKQLLTEALIPVPEGVVLEDERQLEEAADKLGFPLAVKPLDANQGKGITTEILTHEALHSAFQAAKVYSDSVIVEKFIQGNDYRFLLVDFKLIAVALRSPASVTGDGRSTIQELINLVNSDPRRGAGHGNVLTAITVDNQTHKLLRKNDLTLDSVPGKGQIVILKDTANLSTGGTARDVTDEVHPDNVLLAERVAKIVGLDICGIDIMAPDVTTPIALNGGAVLEVNAAPGLRMHFAPSEGTPRDVAGPIIRLLYPSGSPSRIPIVAVTGTNGKTTTVRLIAHLCSRQGYYTGLTTTDGIYLNGRQIYQGDCSGPKSANVVLYDPLVDCAVLECARGGIIRSGLAFDACDIGIVTNVAEDHLGMKDVETLEDLARVKAVVPQAVKAGGYAILNAADDLVYAMKENIKGTVALFDTDHKNERIAEHCRQGGKAAVMDRNEHVIILNGAESLDLGHVADMPLTLGGKAEFMIANVLPAVLSAYLMGFDMDKVKAALKDFLPSPEKTPGRLNHFEINGINVIVDYVHNQHGFKAIGKYLAHIPVKKVGIITGVGDRRDEDIFEIGRIAAGIFNEIIIRIDEDTRGRESQAITDLLVKGICAEQEALPYFIIPDSREALLYALDKATQGEYIFLSADDTKKTLQLVNEIRTMRQESKDAIH